MPAVSWGRRPFPFAIACLVAMAVAILSFPFASAVLAQPAGVPGALNVIVRDRVSGQPLMGVSVFRDGRLQGVTSESGRHRVDRVPAGMRTFSFRRLGFLPRVVQVAIAPGETREVEVVFDPYAIPLGLVTVVAASRRPERLVDAPAAITVVDPQRVRDLAPLGQAPLLVADLPGVHVQQGGAFEFNLNTRGFNFTNNRRVLVLQDGRDLSVPLLGNQEWADLAMLEDASRVELVRGPGSALYGANAFGGVLAVSTPAVRDAQGTRATLSGGLPGTARADLRYGVLSSDARWGYRVSAGAMRGAGWDRSRTDSLALRREYSRSGVSSPAAPAPGYELVPLSGQRTEAPLGMPATAIGDIDPTDVLYGTARVDRYLADGSTVTAEGGTTRMNRLLSTVSTGRSQVLHASRPWARLAWTDSSFTVFAYYNGRIGLSQSLAAPNQVRDRSATLHLEGQYDITFAGGRGGATLGASGRQNAVNTYGTLLSEEGDGSETRYGAVFGQARYALHPRVNAIVAARGDIGSRDARQFSPKAGLQWALAPDQSLRVTFAQGYLIAPPLARWLEFVAGPPLDLRALEGGIRASALGPALAGVPDGALFTNSAAVPLLALGNPDLRPERVSSYEIGYKGQLSALFVSVDAYVSRLDGFLSQLLPGANAAFGSWTAPSTVPDVARAGLEGAVAAALGAGLTRRADGTTAFVLSGGNAGRATERGVEVAMGWRPAPGWQVDANYTWYGFELARGSFLSGDSVLANTPANSGNASVTYTRTNGTRARVGVRMSEAFDWRSALWWGRVPSNASVDVVVWHPITAELSASVVGTNMLDQQRYQFFGGSLVRRRVVASITWRG